MKKKIEVDTLLLSIFFLASRQFYLAAYVDIHRTDDVHSPLSFGIIGKYRESIS